VGWVVIRDVEALMEQGWEADEFAEIHTSIAMGLDELRHDRTIRIIGITGERDGEWYRVPRRDRYFDEPRHRARHNFIDASNSPDRARPPERKVPPAIETLVMLEKPVIARVNGDALGFGQSVLWGCDVIVAIETAVISDVHLGQGVVRDSQGVARGFPYGITPGDGAMAFWPQYLPPPKMKEYQLLSRAWTARELADMNIINYALPTYQEVDAKVTELIEELLARPQHALERTKRVANKSIIQQWNLSADLAQAYEILDFWQHGRAGHMDPTWDPYAQQERVAAPEGGWLPDTSPSKPESSVE
jgi:enoyl-CoA hydratase/carnithine racemase